MSSFEASDTVRIAIRPVRRGPQLQLGVGVGQPPGQVLREHQVDAVVDRHHRPAVHQRRQHVVRRVEEVDALPATASSGCGPARRSSTGGRLDDRPEVRAELPGDPRVVLRPAQQHVLGRPVDARQLVEQVPDVGADAEVVVPSGRRWRCARLMHSGSSGARLIASGSCPFSAKVGAKQAVPASDGASRRTPDGFAGTRPWPRRGSRAATGPAGGGPRSTARSARGGHAARTEAQKSTSSVYRKNRSSSRPTASASARHTSRHAPLTQSTSCAVASDRSTLRRTGPQPRS